MSTVAIVLCAGSGARMRGEVADKTLAPLAGRPVFLHSLQALAEAGVDDAFLLVYRDDEQRVALAEALAAHREFFPFSERVRFVPGGARRQDSVTNALAHVPAEAKTVLVHDAARPLVSVRALKLLLAALATDPAASLARPVTDTLREVESATAGTRHARLRTVDRSQLFAMETPQGFRTELLRQAHAEAARQGWDVTDDTSVVTACGHGVTLVSNPDPNPKLTTPADFAWCEFLLGKSQNHG